MSNSRNLADLLTSTGDVKSDALDNVDSLPTQTSNSGKVLMSDGTDASWVSAGRKNLIINGGFDVWQRGTSTTSTGYKTADRWTLFNESGSLTSVDRSTDVPTNKPFEYSIKIVGNNSALRQWIEKPLQFQTGTVLTFSAWVKGTSGNTFSSDITDRHATARTCTGSWEFITKTFTVDSDRDVDVYVNQHLNIIRGIDTGTYYVTGVQLELGSVATEFEHRSYGEELALCQRYWQQSYTSGVSAGTITDTGAYIERTPGTTHAYLYRSHRLMCEMRGTPTLKYYGTTEATNSVGTWRRSGDSTVSMSTYFANNKLFVTSCNTNGASQRLTGHWTADAEL